MNARQRHHLYNWGYDTVRSATGGLRRAARESRYVRQYRPQLLGPAARRASVVAAAAAAGVIARNRRRFNPSRGGGRRTITGSTSAAGEGGGLKKISKSQKKKKTKKWTSFQKKVLKAVDKDRAFGIVNKVGTFSFYQATQNEWHVDIVDGPGKYWQAFTPAKLVDAYSVAFNAKTNALNGFDTATDNVTPETKIRIISASVDFWFKNVSQHKMTLEMYVCYGTIGQSTTEVAAEWESYITYNAMAGNETSLHAIGSELWHIPPFKKHWRYTKVVFELEPGQEIKHLLKGPKNLSYNIGDHVQIASGGGSNRYLPPNIKGNGCYLFFRTATAPTIGNNGNVTRFANKWSGTDRGGIACEYVEKYVVSNVQGDIPVKNIASLSVLYGSAGSDQQIDADNPAVVITGAL